MLELSVCDFSGAACIVSTQHIFFYFTYFCSYTSRNLDRGRNLSDFDFEILAILAATLLRSTLTSPGLCCAKAIGDRLKISAEPAAASMNFTFFILNSFIG